MFKLNVGDIVSIGNSNHLEIIDEIKDDLVYVKPFQYAIFYSRIFKMENCTPATDSQICYKLSEWVKASYLQKISDEI